MTSEEEDSYEMVAKNGYSTVYIISDQKSSKVYMRCSLSRSPHPCQYHIHRILADVKKKKKGKHHIILQHHVLWIRKVLKLSQWSLCT